MILSLVSNIALPEDTLLAYLVFRNTSNIMMHQFVKNYPTKIGHIKTILTFMLDMGP